MKLLPEFRPSTFLLETSPKSAGAPAYGSRWQNETQVMLSDSLTWTRGRHNIKMGGQFARYHFNTRGATNQRGTIEFDGSRNGLIPGGTVNARSNALIDLLMGLPVRASITLGEFGRGYRQWAYAGFVQDTWKATSKLTVNLGLRYEYNRPWTEVNGKLSNLVPGGSLEVVGSSALPNFWKPDRNDFAPPLGLAYDLKGNGKTVIRAGFGISYETLTEGNSVIPVENNPPFAASAVVRLPTPFSPTGEPSQTLLELRSAARPSRAIAAVGHNTFHTAHMQQFNFSIQRMLSSHLLLEVGYAGTRGLSLPLYRNSNQVPLELLTAAQRALIAADIAAGRDTTTTLSTLRPYSQYDAITSSETIGSSDYHSFQFKLERRFGDGLTFLTTYTFSKSTDNASGYASSDASEQILDANNLDRQHALSSFDMRHRLNVALNYDLPFGRLLKGPNWLVNGWALNSIVALQTGQPFTPFVGTFDPYRNESFNRPNLVGDPNENIPAGYAFNPNAFRVAPQGTFGNAGRNIIWGDGFRSLDLSLFKNIYITERLKLQMRFESVNSLNNVNLQAPSTNLASNPGLFIAAAQPRIIQPGAKLSF